MKTLLVMVLKICYSNILVILIMNILSNATSIDKVNVFKARENRTEWAFKDYLKKFNTLTVWDTLYKNQTRRNWKDITDEQIHKVIEHIDPADELLRLDLDNVEIKNPELINFHNRRTFYPPGKVLPPDDTRDAYMLRPRLYDLMKQAIYQARDKLIIMQDLRAQYRNDSLYKMGFLFSKTDETTKRLSQVAYRAWRHCDAQRRHGQYRPYPIYEQMEAEERVLNLWFELDLLIDLLKKNDDRANILIANMHRVRKESQKRTWFKDDV